MTPEYCKIGSPIDIACEECAELIHAVMKAKRFGMNHVNPKTGVINRDQIRMECDDVIHAVERLLNIEFGRRKT